MKAIVIHFVVVACMANNGKFTSNCDTARKSQGENANDFCRLRGVSHSSSCINQDIKFQQRGVLIVKKVTIAADTSGQSLISYSTMTRQSYVS